MKKYSSQKFISILNEIQAGATITETCRKHNISNSTYYDWLNNLIKNSELKNLKAENDKLMRLIVDQALDIQALRK